MNVGVVSTRKVEKDGVLRRKLLRMTMGGVGMSVVPLVRHPFDKLRAGSERSEGSVLERMGNC